jgi:hypothetical protein
LSASGCCRRLVFAVNDTITGGGGLAVVAKLIVPAELTAEMAQMLAADYAESGIAFERTPANAVAN